MYMKIDGVRGRCPVPPYVGWIDISSHQYTSQQDILVTLANAHDPVCHELVPLALGRPRTLAKVVIVYRLNGAWIRNTLTDVQILSLTLAQPGADRAESHTLLALNAISIQVKMESPGVD